MNQQPTPKFLMIDLSLLSSTKLNLSQKALIAHIQGWQANNKVCFETNKSIGLKLGLKKTGAISLIKSLKKYDFFTALQIEITGHQLLIDDEKLQAFLSNTSIEYQPEPSTPADNSNTTKAIETTPIDEDDEPEAEISVGSSEGLTSLMYMLLEYLELQDVAQQDKDRLKPYILNGVLISKEDIREELSFIL